MKALGQLGIEQPHLAVAALNPHGGEDGLFGREEIEAIKPAIEAARARGMEVSGPVPADCVFHMARIGRYDAVLSLYHDQGHIAAKMMDFEKTVSVTLGCRSCARRWITAPRSTSPARARRPRSAWSRRSRSRPNTWCAACGWATRWRSSGVEPAVMSDRAVRSALWWICLVASPLALVAIELFHPAGFTAQPGMYQFLSRPELHQPQFHALGYFGPQWWFTLHMIQTPLVALVSIGLWQMLAAVTDADTGYARALAWLARAAVLVFLIYYTALNSIGGTGLGRSLLATEALAASGQLDPQQLQG